MNKTQKPSEIACETACSLREQCCLSQLAVGGKGCVVKVGGDVELRRRLLEMGFCNQAAVEVVRRAPLGDPIEFRLRGYHISLRDEQARLVMIARTSDSTAD